MHHCVRVRVHVRVRVRVRVLVRVRVRVRVLLRDHAELLPDSISSCVSERTAPFKALICHAMLRAGVSEEAVRHQPSGEYRACGHGTCGLAKSPGQRGACKVHISCGDGPCVCGACAQHRHGRL